MGLEGLVIVMPERCCTVTPGEIRNDASLLREYPPRPLEGLCDGEMSWR
jgi:hypothetical protein